MNTEMTRYAFFRLFEEFESESEKKIDAYEKAERIHEIIFGFRKYSSYNTFKSVKSHHVQKIR